VCIGKIVPSHRGVQARDNELGETMGARARGKGREVKNENEVREEQAG
jgi:hypothetical protein